MTKLQLFLLLRRHNWLAFRRSPAYEQSVVARVMMVLGAGFAVVYMIFIGTMFGSIANEMSSPGFIILMMLMFLLILDFSSRFVVQKTPAMLLKPYLLIPMPRRAVVESFLIMSLTIGYNWMWLALFIPYSIIVICGGASFLNVFCVLIACMLLIFANSQFYLLVRTLTARSLLWWLLPVVVYGICLIPLLVSAIASEDIAFLEDMMDTFLEAVSQSWIVLPCLLLLVGLLALNRATQFRFAFEEIAQEGKKAVALKSVSQFTFLERFGQTGEFLKLELKSIMRNKAIRSRVISSLALIIVLTLIIAYTEMYNGRMRLNFWCLYCFAIYGMTTIIKVMSPEGNYIDLLMTHRENILLLLRAKYYFHVAILLVPLVLMLPAIIAGKFSLLMVVAYMLLCSGYLYFLLFQMAVYNKQTLPLDAKITGKNNLETGLQLVIEMLALFSPLILVALLVLIFDEQMAYVVLAVIGAVFTLTHPLWLRSIYHRMMKRKYENLEGFLATRS